jgi:hypothetical protein
MDATTLENHTNHLCAAIETLITNRFTLPALILIYSAIDIMAWLNREEDHEDVTRNDFILWADKFLLPDSDLFCVGIDLYAARCSLLHSYTAKSRLSRNRKASVISYAWGAASEDDLQRALAGADIQDVKVVHVEKLFSALKVGIRRFIRFARNKKLILERAGGFFTNMPPMK